MKKNFGGFFLVVLISLGFVGAANALEARPSRQFSSTPVFGVGAVDSTPLAEGTLFASPNGSGNSCSQAAPCTVQTAFSKLSAGDVLFLRGGEYILTASLVIDASGTAANPIIIESYPGELAILNGNETVNSLKADPFSGFSGIRVRKDYVFLRKLEIKQMGLAGVKISGSHNKVEGCEIYGNFLSGINIYGGEWHCNPDCPPYEKGYNLLENNRIYDNSDAGLTQDDGWYADGGSSDGIAVSSGKENKIIHNTVYGNSDDGIDVWRSNDSLIAFNRSYDNGRGDGDGNGIKAGGNLDANATNGLRAVLRNNISYNNRRRGIDYNSGKEVTFLYNTSYHNGTSGFTSDDGSLVEYNIAASNGQNTVIKAGHAHNSWQISGTVEFVSTDPASPDFLRPLPGSAFESMGAYSHLNDDFDHAIDISLHSVENMDTHGATQSSDDPIVSDCNLGRGQATVWYKYTPPADSAISLDTNGADYDTFIAVWTGSRGKLTPVVCNDDTGGTLQSAVAFQVEENKTYFIEVGEAEKFWQPPLGSSFSWQFGDPINTDYDVDIYDVDAFETSANFVSDLHAQGRKAVCYISVGSWEDWRPDAGDFPAEVIGNDYDGWAGEKWLDIRQIDTLAPIMRARLDMCAEKGFDGVEPDNVALHWENTGFPITYADQLAYNIWLSNEAHARGLSIGLKNDEDQVNDLLSYFDWALTEDCFYGAWCDEVHPFIDAGKPVFSAEYTDNTTSAQFQSAVCPQAQTLGFYAFLKNRNLDAYREDCP